MKKILPLICFFTLLWTLNSDVAGQIDTSKNADQNLTEYKNPLLKCWQVNGERIIDFASDNNSIVTSYADGKIVFTDLKNQTEQWSLSLGSRVKTYTKLKEGDIFLVSEPYSIDEGNHIEIRKVAKDTGVIIWTRNFDMWKKISFFNSNTNDQNPDTISVLVSDGYSSMSNLELNTESGELVGDIKIPNSIFYKADRYMNYDDAFAVDRSDFFVSDKKGYVLKIQKGTENKIKLFRTGGEISFIQRIDDHLLVSSNDNYVYFYSLKDNKVSWKKRLSGRIAYAPAIYKDLIFISSMSDPTIYVFSKKEGKKINVLQLDSDEIINKQIINDSGMMILTAAGLQFYSDVCPNKKSQLN